MWAGFHNMNGLKQSINGKLWSTYVEGKSMKQLQHLPDRTQPSASLALLGIPQVECVLHENMPGLFWRWITSKGVEREISLWRVSVFLGLNHLDHWTWTGPSDYQLDQMGCIPWTNSSWTKS